MAGAPVVGLPDATTGAVGVTVVATDPDGDALTYTVSAPTAGTVSPGPVPGSFTYTPSTQARLLAATTPGVDTAQFTVTVSDGQATSTSR